jgi:hypothetical protein
MHQMTGRSKDEHFVTLRNAGTEASAHYETYISPSVLVFDLKKVSGINSPVDVFRVFLQFASRVKEAHLWILMADTCIRHARQLSISN